MKKIITTYLYSFFVLIWFSFQFKLAYHFFFTDDDRSGLYDNWTQPVISEIILIKSNELCLQNYSSLIRFEFGGTKEGCDCRGINPWNGIMTESCIETQINSSCKQIAKIVGNPMPIWKGKNLFCAKREYEETFLKRGLEVNENGGCEPGFRNCNKGSISENDGVFCVSEQTKCPINSIIISQIPPNVDHDESISFETDAGETYTMFISRNISNTLPIVEVLVGEKNLCVNKNESFLSSKHNEYSLMNHKKEGCEQIDHRFSIIDSMSEKDYFSDDKMDFLENILPDFSIKQRNSMESLR